MNDLAIDLRGLLGLLRRQVRLILITAIAVIGAAALVVFSITPIYTASALVLVDTAQKNLLSPDFFLGVAGTDNARVESEMEIMRSDTIVMSVVRDLNLVSSEEFGVRIGWVDRIAAIRAGETEPSDRGSCPPECVEAQYPAQWSFSDADTPTSSRFRYAQKRLP